MRRYSTSFGQASRLLAPELRPHIRNVYALVRVADEVVDGGAAGAGLEPQVAARLLNELERDVERAIEEGYSANLVVHAFARTARAAGFGTELTEPFFASMRMDLTPVEHDRESFERYVHGSAEVVGLMCLRVFLTGAEHPPTPTALAELEAGAQRLGAAFQKVNFLRDLGADAEELGRRYLPGLDPAAPTEEAKRVVLDEIDADLAAAAAAIPLLPAGSRRAVAVAHRMFAELARRIEATPASALPRTRVRVPDPVKLRIALATSGRGRHA
ncbi:MAG: squalene/phytoene synthase family protein [Microbacteriaceae bacterium]|nr:squalene/phytoene synthase family protein [Microbacteriaceae bacterium]